MNEAVDCSLEHQKHPLFQSPMELTLLIPPKRNLHFHFSMTDLYGCTALHHVFAWHNSPEGLLWKCLMFRIGSLGAKLNHYLFFITLEHVFNHYTGRGSRKRIGIKKKKNLQTSHCPLAWTFHRMGWVFENVMEFESGKVRLQYRQWGGVNDMYLLHLFQAHRRCLNATFVNPEQLSPPHYSSTGRGWLITLCQNEGSTRCLFAVK